MESLVKIRIGKKETMMQLITWDCGSALRFCGEVEEEKPTRNQRRRIIGLGLNGEVKRIYPTKTSYAPGRW